ncbi:MAG: hypothetical protein JW765_01080 [Deltaproteobacteria bacterium]|nr:hypothetical protein [Candidatus Zymogenaceae bacterium]
MYSDHPFFSACLYRCEVSSNGHRPKAPRHRAHAALIAFMICLVLVGCQPPDRDVERVFSRLPKRNYDSIECSNLPATRDFLGLAAVNHTSSVDKKLGYFTLLAPFTFSTGEYSFLVSDKTPLGFDPSDFYVTVVARTSSYSITLVSGDFDTDTIRTRLSQAGYRTEDYHGRTVYYLPWSDAPAEGGLFLTYANLTFVDDDIIASAPTEGLLKDYLDRVEVGTMDEDRIVMGLVEKLKGESSFYISRGVRTDELYGEDSLFIRSPDDWGFPEYRLSPYTYFAFGIRPAADRRHQRVTLLILYPDAASVQNDIGPLTEGLKSGKSLSRLVPFADLFTAIQVTADGDVLTALIESKNDFDMKILIRLKDLPFLVY